MGILTAPPESGVAGAAPGAASLRWLRICQGVAARPESTVTLFTGLNLTVSFFNQVVLAYLFGASAEMDAFLAAGALPLTFVGLVIGEMGFVLVPLLTHHRENGEELSEITSRLFSLLALTGLGLSLLGCLGHAWILRLTTSSAAPPATLALAIRLAPWVWLLVGLNFLSSFFTGLYHFHRRFTLPTVVLTFPYLGMMVGGLAGAPRLGISSVVYGWLAGTFFKTVLLAAGIWKPSALHWRWSFRHPINRELGFSLLPMGIALLPFTALPVVDAYWASGLPHGSLSTLGYASRIAIALTAIVVQGIVVVLFPAMAEDGMSGNHEEFRRKVSQAIQSILLVILPVAALTAALRLPLLEMLLERGQFDRADTLAVARVLPFYLVGMVAMAPMSVVSRGFFALRDYKTPAKLGLLALALYGLLCALLTPRFSYVGIGLAYAVLWLLTFLVQAYLLGRRVGKVLDGEVLRLLAQVGGCSLLAAVAAGRLLEWLRPLLGVFPGVLVAGLTGLLLVWGISYFVLKNAHLRMLVAVAVRR